ncbi:MAG TPA: TPM domain-containing protein [Fulvivirga sp.]|nr:TPM domain-containing protein [Fulvivirga sp.]
MEFPKILIPILVMLFISNRGTAFTRITDDTGLLSDLEKVRVEEALKKLPGVSHVYLAQNFDGKKSFDFALYNYTDILYNGVAPGSNGFLLVYSVQDKIFDMWHGSRYTHRIEEQEKETIINQYLVPAFAEGHYAEGLVEALDYVRRIIKENSTLLMSDEMQDPSLRFFDETGQLSNVLSESIQNFLKVNGVIRDEHNLYIRNSTFDPNDYDPDYIASSALSVSYDRQDDLYAQYAQQIYQTLFKDEHNYFQVGTRKKPDLTLICLFGDKLYLETNWEQFIEVESTTLNSHTRTLSNYFEAMYADYVAVGRNEAGIMLLLKKVTQLSRGEIEGNDSDLQPTMFSAAWFNNPFNLIATIAAVLFLCMILFFAFSIKKRRT